MLFGDHILLILFMFLSYYYAFQSESTLYSCLNVKELLARSRRQSIVKQGHPLQSLTCDFLIYKNGYQETLKLFTYTPHFKFIKRIPVNTKTFCLYPQTSIWLPSTLKNNYIKITLKMYTYKSENISMIPFYTKK